MRELILKRIEEIRQMEKGFSKDFTRWRNVTIGYEKTHISKYDFNACSDEELLQHYERIVRQMSKMM